ncbi:MAG: hypothetical protein WAU86_16510 [Oricola sp.]
MVRQLPRLMLAAMFCSIVSLGVAVKLNRFGATYATESFTGTTFDRS